MYRLTFVGDADSPIVDAKMRPLRPLRFSFDFQVRQDATTHVFSFADGAPFGA
jgi:hypothetical protein